MYNEDYEKTYFPYRNFFIKIIIVIAIALILAWIIPKIFNNKQEIEGISNDVFSNNLEKMKSVAISYYNEDNLPLTIGTNKKMTLNNMIKNKLIKKLADKDGNICDQNKSFIKITKKENEYLLKVNLVCNEEEDYIIAHLNNNSYCSKTYLCEIKSDNKEEDLKEEEHQQNEEKLDSKENSKKTITQSTNKKKKIITTKKRKVKKKSSSKGTIEVVDTTNKLYLYEYAKNNNATFSNWSLWNNWERVSCNTSEIKCTNTNINCLKELKRYNRKENISTYQKEYKTTKQSIKLQNQDIENVCSSNNYIKINNKIYKITNASNISYNKINEITKDTKSNQSGWIYKGTESYQIPPTDTIYNHYILVSVDYSKCNNTCQSLPNYYYDQYVYTSGLIEVNSYLENCSSTENKVVQIYSNQTENVNFSRQETLYGTVCYKSERTRNLLNKGTIVKKWSTYNNTKLLSNGYYYTGNKKKK